MLRVDYAQGDYRSVAQRLLPAAERLVERCAPGAGQVVVDVATGSGNTAHLCRERGAQVVAVDLEVAQLHLGRRDDDGIGWVVGDAVRLPLRDGCADQVLSTFGLIFAPDPVRAVEQAARTCRRGGTIGLTTWPDDHVQQAHYELVAAVLPELHGGHEPLACWGSERALRDRLGAVAEDVTVERAVLRRTYASVEAWWDDRVRTAPPVVTARRHLSAEQFAHLGERMQEEARRFGQDTDEGWELREEYLLAVGRVR